MSTLLNEPHTTQVTCSPSRYKQTPGFYEVFSVSHLPASFSSSFFSCRCEHDRTAGQNGKECRLPCRVRSLTLTRDLAVISDHCGCCYFHLARRRCRTRAFERENFDTASRGGFERARFHSLPLIGDFDLLPGANLELALNVYNWSAFPMNLSVHRSSRSSSSSSSLSSSAIQRKNGITTGDLRL